MGTEHSASVTPGTIAVDGDDPDPDPTVVVNTPTATADEWNVPGGTLADDNPSYDSDESVVVVVYLSDLERTPYAGYSGPWPMPLRPISQSNARHYSFPESRLNYRDQREPIEVPTSDLKPSPYHVERFGMDDPESVALVERIREQGFRAPVVTHHRESGEHVLLNGHRRVWAASVLGLDMLPVRPRYAQSSRTEAELWAKNHLPYYDDNQRATAFTRLRDRLGDEAAREVMERHADAGTVAEAVAGQA
jgi:hypothetical protein